jgi:hypothetical protein
LASRVKALINRQKNHPPKGFIVFFERFLLRFYSGMVTRVCVAGISHLRRRSNCSGGALVGSLYRLLLFS